MLPGNALTLQIFRFGLGLCPLHAKDFLGLRGLRCRYALPLVGVDFVHRVLHHRGGTNIDDQGRVDHVTYRTIILIDGFNYFALLLVLSLTISDLFVTLTLAHATSTL